MRDLFLLDPDIVFLNHGSFGACPRPVFETYQYWQRELERDPIHFFGRRAPDLLDNARAKLGAYLNTQADNLIFVPNATHGMNIIARSIKFQPGDEILSTNHEYGAVNSSWDFMCKQTGAVMVHRPVDMPVTTAEEFIENIWAGVTPRTKVISISHITSPTALIFPIEEICRRAREAGILTFIDGAHAPGQIDLDLEAIGADFYTGNCHKWMCAPKGSGFLYARPDRQAMVEPLVVSPPWDEDSTFVSRNTWQGTRDLSAFLTVPAAIDFMQEHNWNEVRQRCHALASDLRGRMADITGLTPRSPDSTEWFSQMIAIPLPEGDISDLGKRLWEEYKIEVPIYPWQGNNQVRVSFQAYNTIEDSNRLVEALTALVPL